MVRQYKKDLRFMRNGNTFALDTMTGIELLQAADQCLTTGKGNSSYLSAVRGIVQDAKGQNDFYVTLKMRRVLMGFIRPVFEEEWRKRNKTALTSGVRL